MAEAGAGSGGGGGGGTTVVAGVDVSNVADSVGHLLIEPMRGTILDASGELSDVSEGGSGAAVAATILKMLRDAGSVLDGGKDSLGKPPFRRMTITFGDFHYVVAITDAGVLVVKRGTGLDAVE
mmetsp:Transcript_46341/g.129185  ORF Transcript_46341/g.129185 Transcript_46341/m.129185 type:complete len:124 (-) Transcript_46341:3-374(-)